MSEPPYDEANLGAITGDALESVRANRLRLAQALDRDPSGFLLGHQVHAAGVRSSDVAPAPNPFSEGDLLSEAKADGQITANPLLTPLVQVADCLPVALHGPRATGMIHCGWRGLAAGIVERGVAATGATAAAVGPGIGPCCFEVGDEVRDEFAELGEGLTTGRMLDLPEVARRLLARAGVQEIEVAGLCTKCDAELFFSHRRDGERAGRQAGVAWADA